MGSGLGIRMGIFDIRRGILHTQIRGVNPSCIITLSGFGTSSPISEEITTSSVDHQIIRTYASEFHGFLISGFEIYDLRNRLPEFLEYRENRMNDQLRPYSKLKRSLNTMRTLT